MLGFALILGVLHLVSMCATYATCLTYLFFMFVVQLHKKLFDLSSS